MNRRHRAVTLLACGALLLSGCASSSTGATRAAGGRPSPAMNSGMVMPDGSTMGADSQSPMVASAGTRPPATTGSPSPAAKMICAAETHATIAKILGLKTRPASTESWRNDVYTCTYRLPLGTLVVSVKQSASPAAAAAYFTAHRSALGRTESLDGLGQRSYGTKTGTVVLLKDNDTLTVDATRLPAVFGHQQSRRFDFAYELASDILGCWTSG